MRRNWLLQPQAVGLFWRGWPQVAGTIILSVLLVASACTAKPKLRASTETADSEATPGGQRKVASTTNGSDPGLNLNCIFDRLQNPAESFHYVYKKTESDGTGVHQEADFAPQSVDGFRVQPDGSHTPIHAVRSDPQAWQSAMAGLTGISGMAGTVSTFNHSSAMQREPDGGRVNGYETVHYSIDTARWDEATRRIVGNFALGPGGFDKGDVWVMTGGCPVKLALDEEMHKKDGTLLAKIHYEEAMSKK